MENPVVLHMLVGRFLIDLAAMEQVFGPLQIWPAC